MKDKVKDEEEDDSDGKNDAKVEISNEDLKDELWSTVGEGRVNELKKFIKKYESLDLPINEENYYFDEDGGHVFMHCVKEGCDRGPAFGRDHIQCLRLLSELDADVNHQDKAGRTALHWAIFHKNVNMVAELVRLGAHPHLRDQDGIDCVHLCIQLGAKDSLKLIAKERDGEPREGEFFDKKDGKGVPPLVSAVQSGNLEICRQLLEYGADVNLFDRKFRRTALHHAVLKERIDIFDLLLKYTPDIDIGDIRGKTVFHRVCASKDIRYFQRLLKTYGGIPDSVMDQSAVDGVTPVIAACQNGNPEQLKELLDREVSVSEADNTGKTALHYCADNLETQCAEMILHKDKSLLDAKDDQGFTPLHMAVIGGNAPLLKLLLKKGADINCLDNERHTVAHWATVCGHLEVLDILLDNGADVSKADSHDAYPIHYAAQMNGKENGHSDHKIGEKVLKKLIDNGVPFDVLDKDGRPPLLWAASAGNSESCKLLVKAGADVNAIDKDGLSAIHCAASRGHVKCVESLKNIGADVDLADKNNCTPLFYAITLGNKECTKALLKFGANPNHQDNRGRTPTHCASIKGCIDTVKMLDKHTAHLWTASSRGDCPIHEASQGGFCDVVKYLLRANNDPDAVNKPNKNGRTSLHIAAIVNNLPLCKLLIDNGADKNAKMSHKDKSYTPYDAAVVKGNKETADYIKGKGGNTADEATDTNKEEKDKEKRQSKSAKSRRSVITLESTPEDPREDEQDSEEEKKKEGDVILSPVENKEVKDTEETKETEEKRDKEKDENDELVKDEGVPAAAVAVGVKGKGKKGEKGKKEKEIDKKTKSTEEKEEADKGNKEEDKKDEGVPAAAAAVAVGVKAKGKKGEKDKKEKETDKKTKSTEEETEKDKKEEQTEKTEETEVDKTAALAAAGVGVKKKKEKEAEKVDEEEEEEKEEETKEKETKDEDQNQEKKEEQDKKAGKAAVRVKRRKEDNKKERSDSGVEADTEQGSSENEENDETKEEHQEEKEVLKETAPLGTGVKPKRKKDRKGKEEAEEEEEENEDSKNKEEKETNSKPDKEEDQTDKNKGKAEKTKKTAVAVAVKKPKKDSEAEKQKLKKEEDEKKKKEEDERKKKEEDERKKKQEDDAKVKQHKKEINAKKAPKTKVNPEKTPNSPEKSKPSSPEKSKPSSPEKSKPSSPEKSKPSSPEKSKPSSPEKQKPSSPEKAKPSSPEKEAAKESAHVPATAAAVGIAAAAAVKKDNKDKDDKTKTKLKETGIQTDTEKKLETPRTEQGIQTEVQQKEKQTNTVQTGSQTNISNREINRSREASLRRKARSRSREHDSDGEFEVPDGSPESEAALLAAAALSQERGNSSSDSEQETKPRRRSIVSPSKVKSDGKIQQGLLTKSPKQPPTRPRSVIQRTPSPDDSDEEVTKKDQLDSIPPKPRTRKDKAHSKLQNKTKSRGKDVGGGVAKPASIHKQIRERKRARERERGLERERITTLYDMDTSNEISDLESMLAKKGPRGRAAESIQESVRRYQDQRRMVRQLHQLKRAQIYTGPMHDVVLFSKLMDVYKNSAPGEDESTLDSQVLEDWEGYLKDQLRFVSNFYEDDRTDIRKQAKQRDQQRLEGSASSVRPQDSLREDLNSREEDRVNSRAKKTDNSLRDVHSRASASLEEARKMNEELEKEYRAEYTERLKSGNSSKKEYQWLLNEAREDEIRSRAEQIEEERKEKHRDWHRKKDDALRKKLMKVYGPSPEIYEKPPKSKGSSPTKSSPHAVFHSTPRPRSTVTSMSGGHSQPNYDREITVQMTEYGMRRVKQDDMNFGKKSKSRFRRGSSDTSTTANWTPKFDGSLRPRAGLVYVEPPIYDEVLRDERRIRTAYYKAARSGTGLSLTGENSFLSPVGS